LTLKRHQPPDCKESEAQPHDRRLAVSIRAPQSRTMTVAKLRGARDRKRATGVKVEGRLSHAQERPEVVAMAKSLHALRLSLRAIAERLEAAGHVNSNGRRFAAVSVRNCQRGDRMIRREFIAGLGGAAAWPLAAQGQQRANPMKRIAYIGLGVPIDAIFQQEFARLGWVEGRDVRIETLFEKDSRIVRAAAPFIVGTAPDLIVVIGTETVEIFKGLTDTIPIVFGFVADPVARNVVKSLARPGGNLTGFTSLEQFSLGGKWLGLLKELVPSVDRVMVFSDPAAVGLVSAAQEAAATLHVTIHPVITTAMADAEREIEALANQPASGMIVIPTNLTVAERATITALAARHRLRRRGIHFRWRSAFLRA
jgi:putative tryptophan/tyrosine transport system substrate-binding protein